MSFLLQNTGQILISRKNRKSSVSWNEHFLLLVVGTLFVPSVTVLIHKKCYIYDNFIYMGYLFAMSEYCIFFYALPSVRVVLSLLRSYACPPAKEPLRRPTETAVAPDAGERRRNGKIRRSRCGTGVAGNRSTPVRVGAVGLGEGSLVGPINKE